MTASGLPAVLIRLAISVVPGVASGDALFEEIADIAESIDDVRGAPIPVIGLEEVDEPPISADFASFRASGPAGGFVVTIRSGAPLVSFAGLVGAFDLYQSNQTNPRDAMGESGRGANLEPKRARPSSGPPMIVRT